MTADAMNPCEGCGGTGEIIAFSQKQGGPIVEASQPCHCSMGKLRATVIAQGKELAKLEAMVESMLSAYEKAFEELCERGMVTDASHREAMFIRAEAARRLAKKP